MTASRLGLGDFQHLPHHRAAARVQNRKIRDPEMHDSHCSALSAVFSAITTSAHAESFLAVAFAFTESHREKLPTSCSRTNLGSIHGMTRTRMTPRRYRP